MKKPTLLTQFEYAILPSAIAVTESKKNNFVAEQLPLMKVVIDFEHGHLKLEGDWHFMMSTNKNNDANGFECHLERVQIETDIYASSAIDLNHRANDGLAFPLHGSIKDGNSLSSCSGLLAFDKDRRIALTNDLWNISLYLYDVHFFEWEIKFTLPILGTGNNENEN
jgi:hypothetical protein